MTRNRYRNSIMKKCWLPILVLAASMGVSDGQQDAKIDRTKINRRKRELLAYEAEDDGNTTKVKVNQRRRLRARGLWRRQPRIVGGQNSKVDQYPFFVQLPNGCGGTLIHSDLVLTAAHCVHGSQNMAILRSSPPVYIGGVETKTGQRRTIEEYRVDPRYQPLTGSYDFAILLLDKPVDVAPVKVNSDPVYPMNGTPLAVVGYGHTNQGAQTGSTNLQHAMVNYRSDCSTYGPGRIKSYEMMCANAPDYSRDACQGDSGGPLIDSDNLLVGVVSWGEGCAQEDAPGVYARVSAASEWIEQQKCDLSNFAPPDCLCTKFSPDCVEIRIDVHYDSYPSETGWKLIRQSDRKVLVSSPISSITGPPFVAISYPVLVPAAAYEVEVDDSYGDGICCKFGAGFVTVFNGSREIQHPGVFGGKTVRPFEVAVQRAPEPKDSNAGSGSTIAPTAAPTPVPRMTLRVEIFYDWYPEETSWELVDDTTGIKIHSSAAYSVLTPMQLVVTDIPDLFSGHSYTLAIMDIAKDGLCCAYGRGFARLAKVLQDGSETSLLWSHEGNFGASIHTTVTLP